jgi:hypothetical protein
MISLQFCNDFCNFVFMMTTEQSLNLLFSKRAWHKHSGIKESTARVYKKRFMENKLEMETRIKILRACGFKLVQDMQWEEQIDHDQIKKTLIDKLKRENAFWSYKTSSSLQISDDKLIEMVLLHLDIDDIHSLFQLFPKKRIKVIWKEKILSQEPLYHDLNRLYAFLFFYIKDPELYIRNHVRKHFKSIQCMD